MIAYHFPPMAGSSGIQRTLGFARELPTFGWQPQVLTVTRRAYERISPDLLPQIPPDMAVTRAFALDARRHLSLFKHYPGWAARPDRWLTWLLGAIPAGLHMIRERRPDVLWSTYPVPTAHLIGYWLSKLSGIPWVADFRDPMAHEGYPAEPKLWRSFLRTEQRVFSLARQIVVTTPGAARLYRGRYPEAAERIGVVENACDETVFAELEGSLLRRPLNPGCITLLHSGVVYPEWRNPAALFAAVRQLIDQGHVDAARLRLRFRAPENGGFVAQLAATCALSTIVEVLSPIDYRDALAEMMCSEGLIVLQSAGCNDQIPAKLYEYLRADRPILGLTAHAGDTAQALRNAGMANIAELESVAETADALLRMLSQIATGRNGPPDANPARFGSRRDRAHELARLLEPLCPAQAR